MNILTTGVFDLLHVGHINFLENIKGKKDKLILLDNAGAHRKQIVKDTLKKNNNSFQYTVPYKPKTNPIEEFFNQLKHYIKLESPITFEDIEKTIKSSLKK